MADIIKAKDGIKDRIAVLRKFGFDKKSLQQAIWAIPNQSSRYLWIANLGDYDGGDNKLSEDGLKFTDRRNPKDSGADGYGTHHSPDVERILFLKTQRYGKTIFEFAGVFKPDLQRSILNVSVWERVSAECSLPDGSWEPSDVSG